MKNKHLSSIPPIEEHIETSYIDVVFEEVNPTHQTVEFQLLSHQSKMGVRVQSVAVPNGFNLGIKGEKDVLKWLSNTIQNEFYSSRVLFLKYNAEGEREDWQNNKATNRRFLETKNLYKRGLYFNKLFQTNS